MQKTTEFDLHNMNKNCENRRYFAQMGTPAVKSRRGRCSGGEYLHGGTGGGGCVRRVDICAYLVAEALADGCSADHDGRRVTDAGLFCKLHYLPHLLHRCREQGRAGDNVAVMLLCRLNKFLRRDIGPEIVHLDAAALEHYLDEILADIVQVAQHRADAGRANGAAASVLGHHVRLEYGGGGGHAPCGNEHFGNEGPV